MASPIQPIQAAPPALAPAVCACLLLEKTEAGELPAAFETLAAERHAQYHTKASSRSERAAEMKNWRKCTNPVCVAARGVLERATSGDITVTPFMATRAAQTRLMFEQTPAGLRTYLEEKGRIVKPGIIL